MTAIIFDIDGTLALRGSRDPYSWQQAGEDKPNGPIIEILRGLVRSGHETIFVTGRPEDARDITERWLDRYVGHAGQLFMRPSGDYRSDAIIKREIFERHIRGAFDVVAVFDDRNSVVRMWRDELRITCLQVADGDF